MMVERTWNDLDLFQYRKRYGLNAMSRTMDGELFIKKFQYRKRYGLHAMGEESHGQCAQNAFQYRKRYGLHAICLALTLFLLKWRFNTASGMDCMQ